jgi:hypothetical protein
MDPDLQALIATAKTNLQVSRAANLTIPLGDKAASMGATAYYRYNVSTVKSSYQSWMAGAPRVLSDILNVPGSRSQKTPLTVVF